MEFLLDKLAPLGAKLLSLCKASFATLTRISDFQNTVTFVVQDTIKTIPNLQTPARSRLIPGHSIDRYKAI